MIFLRFQLEIQIIGTEQSTGKRFLLFQVTGGGLNNLLKSFPSSHLGPKDSCENAPLLVQGNSSRELGAMPQKHTPVVLRKTQSLAFNMTAGHGCWRSHHISRAVLALAWRSEPGRASEPLHSIPSSGASSPTCRETNL